MVTDFRKLRSKWALTTFGEIGQWFGGGTPSKSNPGYWTPGTIPWVSPKDMKASVITGAADHISDQALQAKRLSVIPEGSLLLVTRSGILSHTLPVAVAQVPVTINQDLKAIVPEPGVSAEYLALFCRAFTRDILRGCAKRGTTVASLNTRELQQFHIPLPPYTEQRRIVAKIEALFSELDKGVESLTTARAQLKTYHQALLKHAFEGRLTEQWRREHVDDLMPVARMLERVPPVPRPNRWSTRSKDTILGHSALAVGNPDTRLPDGWLWVPLVDVARMESGHTPSRRHPEWWGGDVPWIGIADAKANNGRVILETAQSTNEAGLANSAARLLPAGTVCVSRTASVGYVVEMGKPMATSQDFVNWVPTEAVTSAWLRLVFGADRDALRRFGKGTTHKTIYFPEWLSVHIALPPVEEQIEIVQQVEAHLSQLEQLEQTTDTALEQAEALRQSILKRAFEGRLVPQDPNDEPAAELLARMRAGRQAQPKGRRARDRKQVEA